MQINWKNINNSSAVMLKANDPASIEVKILHKHKITARLIAALESALIPEVGIRTIERED